jgi:hypothetical protein
VPVAVLVLTQFGSQPGVAPADIGMGRDHNAPLGFSQIMQLNLGPRPRAVFFRLSEIWAEHRNVLGLRPTGGSLRSVLMLAPRKDFLIPRALPWPRFGGVRGRVLES